MRWGVKDENTLDHKTWIECAKGVQWCKESSVGIAFMSLQGDKYGYTPLPKTVLKHDLDRHLLSTEGAADTKKLIFEWYVLDENAQPNEYVLRNLTDKDDPAYWAALKLMLPAMRGLPFDAQRHPGLLIGKSVTEWEMRAALGPHPTELDRKTAFCWSHRRLAGEVTDRMFRDTGTGFNPYLDAAFEELQALWRGSSTPPRCRPSRRT